MAIAAHETREDKLKWLQRPFDWALNVCWFSFALGLALYLEGRTPLEYICVALIAALGIACGLAFWGLHRMSYAAGRL